MPPDVQEIEIIYAEGRAPRVSLKSKALPPSPPSYRPSGPIFDLRPILGKVQSLEGCESRLDQDATLLRINTTAKDQPCSYVLPLLRQEATLDGLSYHTLHFGGESAGPMRLALVDRAAKQKGDRIPLTSVNGQFDVRLSLAPLGRQLDLRRLVALVLMPEEKQHTLTVTRLALEQAGRAPRATPRLGFWVWDYHKALAQDRAILEACRRYKADRLMVQMPALEESGEIWSSYAGLIYQAKAAGIEIFALDGYPEAIQTPTALVEKVRRILTLTGGKGLAGIQLDIEPYLLPNFFADDSGFVRYLAAIDQVKKAIAGRSRLSVVMPFWFTSVSDGGRPVAFSVMDRVDEVAIMSYRTDVEELRVIAEDSLRYGDLVETPVWLSVETRALPLEHHVTLERESRRELADAYLDRSQRRLVLEPPSSNESGLDWFRMRSRITVRPERLTFAGKSRLQVRSAISGVTASVSNPSLAGLIVHDLDGFAALTQ